MTIRARVKQLAKWIAESVLILMITLVLLEAGLWALSAVNQKVSYLTATGKDTNLLDPVLERRLDPNYPGHDRDGFRNTAVLEQADVVALGDSMTYGMFVAPESAWPQQLARQSGESVYNMGVSGYGPVHYLILTPRALQKHPKWLVSTLYDGNDLFDSFRLAHWNPQMSDLLSKDTALIAAIDKAQSVEDFDSLANRLSGFSSEDIHAFLGDNKASFDWKSKLIDYFKRHCKTWNLVRSARLLMLQSGTSAQSGLLGRIFWKYSRWKAAKSSGLLVAFERGSLKTVFMPSYRAVVLRLDDPRIREGLSITEEAYRRSAKETRATNTQFSILMIPTKELVYYQAFSNTGDKAIQQVSELASLELAFRAQFKRDICDQGIMCIDPLPALTDALKAGQNPFPMSHDGHPNPLGPSILADSVRRAIEPKR